MMKYSSFSNKTKAVLFFVAIYIVTLFPGNVFASVQKVSVDRTLVCLGDTVTVTIEGELSDLENGVIVKIFEDDIFRDDYIGEEIVEYKYVNGKAVATLKWLTQECADGEWWLSGVWKLLDLWGKPEFRFEVGADGISSDLVNTDMANPGMYVTNIPVASPYEAVEGTNSETAADGVFVKKYLRGNLEEIAGSTYALKYEMIETMTQAYSIASSAINFAQAIPAAVQDIKMLYVAALTELSTANSYFPPPGNIASWSFNFWSKTDMAWHKDGYGKIILPSEIYGPGDITVKAILIPSINQTSINSLWVGQFQPQAKNWTIRVTGPTSEQIIDLGNYYLATEGTNATPREDNAIRVRIDQDIDYDTVAEVTPQEKIHFRTPGEYTVELLEDGTVIDGPNSDDPDDPLIIKVHDNTSYYNINSDTFLLGGINLRLTNIISGAEWLVFSSDGNVVNTISGSGNYISTIISGLPDGEYFLKGKANYSGSKIGYTYLFYKDNDYYYVDPNYTPPDPPEPTIEIYFPTSSTEIAYGADIYVSWNSSYLDNTALKIELIGEEIFSLNSSASLGGSYNYPVPTSAAPGSYYIKISDKNDPSVTSQSPIFQILEPPACTNDICLFYPEAGETFTPGETYQITWDYNLGSDETGVNIILIKGGGTERWIAEDVTMSQRYYDWEVPISLDPDDDYQIHIYNREFAGSLDDYSGYFSISPPPEIIVSNPTVVDEFHLPGTRMKIEWTTTGSIGEYVKIWANSVDDDLFDDIEIAEIHATAKSFTWTIPGNAYGKYNIRVRSVKLFGHIYVQGASPGNIYILTPPDITSYLSPSNTATKLSLTTSLSWEVAKNADSYNVYFGTNPNYLFYKGNQTNTTYTPANLEYDATYYWRIDSVNAAGSTTGDTWVFETETSPSVSGTVYSLDTKIPLANYWVDACDPYSGEVLGNSFTDENGWFLISKLPEGHVIVKAGTSDVSQNYAKGYFTTTGEYTYGNKADEVSVQVGEITEGIDIFLSPTGGISGKVYEPDTTTPVVGMTIEVYETSGEDNVTAFFLGGTTTDENGEYTINHIPIGNVVVQACPNSSSNYINQYFTVSGDFVVRYNEADEVSISANSVTEHIDFILKEGGRVSGSVFEKDGATGIGGVLVMASLPGCGDWLGSTYTDENGNYTITGLPETVTVSVSPPYDTNYLLQFYNELGGYIRYCSDADTVTVMLGGETDSIDFVLNEGSSLTGFVYRDDGVTPVPNAIVSVYDINCDHLFSDSWTDENGEYTVEEIPIGNVKVHVDPGNQNSDLSPEYYSTTGQSAFTCLEADEVEIVSEITNRLIFSLESVEVTAGTVSGTVSSKDGTIPITNVQVSVYRSECGEWLKNGRTDENGTYSISGLPAGDIIVSVFPGNSAFKSYLWTYYTNSGKRTTSCSEADLLSITLGTQILADFYLDLGGSISGTIYANNRVTPLPDVSVRAYEKANGSYLANSFNTDSTGTYTIPGIPVGEAILYAYPSASSESYLSEYYKYSGEICVFMSEADSITIAPGIEMTGFDFSLDIDTDDDRMGDEWENTYFGDLSHDGNSDSDNDGLIDREEYNRYSTNPNDPDSDNDGINDGDEISNGTDPNNSVKAMPWIPLLLLGE